MARNRPDIETWIAAEISRLTPGERLPTVRDMMRRFRTAQRTIEAALAPHIDTGRLTVRRGAGICVAEPRPPEHLYEADVLVLYRISASRLARSLLTELERRLKACGKRILLLGFSEEDHALSVLSRLGRFRVCLIQVHFEPLPLSFLAGIAGHSDSVVVDGISTTGVGVDAIGTNWREALAIAVRHLNRKGHRRIAFLTSAHPARQIAMARREYLRLCEGDEGGSWLIEIKGLPGDFMLDDLITGIRAHRRADGSLPFTALVTWGVVDGRKLDHALGDLGLLSRAELSVLMLGSVDNPVEHLDRFDVVGNSNAEKVDRFEGVILSRLGARADEPTVHYLPVHHRVFGSVETLTD